MAWRDLNRGVRIAILIVVAAVIVLLLFTVVFPRVERYFEDPTLSSRAPAVLTASGRG